MDTWVSNWTLVYKEQLDRGDPRVENWMLMKSPLPSVAVCAVYLVAVISGPRLMADRAPLSLKWLLLPYNLMLVLCSAYMFCEFLVTSYLAQYSYTCQPVDYSSTPLALRMASACWLFFLSKFIELGDTIFFICRKKFDQLTLLHVYHHCFTIINSWIGVKYVAGGQSFFPCMMNSFVHVVMYIYYALAALGPELQPYLWWKRYLTRLQLVQFVLSMSQCCYSLAVHCDYSPFYNVLLIAYNISLLVLFSNFYYKAYTLKHRQHSLKQQ